MFFGLEANTGFYCFSLFITGVPREDTFMGLKGSHSTRLVIKRNGNGPESICCIRLEIEVLVMELLDLVGGKRQRAGCRLAIKDILCTPFYRGTSKYVPLFINFSRQKCCFIFTGIVLLNLKTKSGFAGCKRVWMARRLAQKCRRSIKSTE
jgi:hypothetical protein